MNTKIMKKFFHKKKWNAGFVQVHVDPPLVNLIKIKHNDKSDKDFVKIKLHKDPTSEILSLYESKM